MRIPTTRRKKSKKERALDAVGTAASATATFVKAKVAWVAGRKAAKVAAPAVAVGTAAVVAKKRSGHREQEPAAV